MLKHLSSVRSPTAQGLGRKASDAGLGSGFASWLCDLQQVTELQLTVLICKIGEPLPQNGFMRITDITCEI